MGFTVLIVDDHPTFRKYARRLLEHAGYEVVGEAENGATAIEAARAFRPMAVLLDVLLPDISGFAVADELAGTLAGGSVVLTSSRSARDLGAALKRYSGGGKGYAQRVAFHMRQFSASLHTSPEDAVKVELVRSP